MREAFTGAQRYETSGDALYDPATDTIYDAPAPKGPPGTSDERKQAARKAAERAKDRGRAPVDPRDMPASDPIVTKVRVLLEGGQMEVTGREVHDGTDAWVISLRPNVGRPVWTLWVSAADGKPLELRDPGRDASEAPQVIRWSAYEVLPARDAGELVTLRGAHPSARVVHDPAQAAAAQQRLGLAKP
jgi:hypothetical protein